MRCNSADNGHPAGRREGGRRARETANLALVADVPILVDSRLLSAALTAHYAEAMAYPTGTAELAAEIRQRQEELMRDSTSRADCQEDRL
jgi:hypothetical protein